MEIFGIIVITIMAIGIVVLNIYMNKVAKA